jgi:hypothetical protein
MGEQAPFLLMGVHEQATCAAYLGFIPPPLHLDSVAEVHVTLRKLRVQLDPLGKKLLRSCEESAPFQHQLLRGRRGGLPNILGQVIGGCE